MRADQIFLTEGATADTRGALTSVGVNQRVYSFALPFRLQLRAVIMLTDEVEGADGAEFDDLTETRLAISVTGPAGDSVFSWAEPVTLPDGKSWVDLPLLATVVTDVIVSGNEYGIYIVEVRCSTEGLEEYIRRIPVYIISPPQNSTPAEQSLRAFQIAVVS